MAKVQFAPGVFISDAGRAKEDRSHLIIDRCQRMEYYVVHGDETLFLSLWPPELLGPDGDSSSLKVNVHPFEVNEFPDSGFQLVNQSP